ncbi:helix-turn-helix domain-containing protein [Paenibacillus elgii]|uniref:helix-turn-helix domain-containing protein n=1 Tax=Paenibacillus elgii TaxID=189691 RepID=UPI001CB918E3|nr:helix-turn-helix transcriptional regulator [Paenibacillus elgii]
MSVLAERLRHLREDKGWSQTYVAGRLGIKRSSTYANWEYGIRDPDTETLVKLAQIFEVTRLFNRSIGPCPVSAIR